MAGIGLMLVRNFTVYFTGKSSEHFVYPKMSGPEKLTFWLGRIFNITIYVVVPVLIFPWWLALASFLVFSFTAGTVMAHVLMLAHVRECVDFVEPAPDPLRVDDEWAVHQVRATMNFSPRNPVINWFTGGLNYQIEHHLFPRYCHLIYPKLAPIVEQTCREFGVPYHSNSSFLSSLADHYRSLKAFGRPPVTT
jgi:linoleoyl-CoA desaturase